MLPSLNSSNITNNRNIINNNQGNNTIGNDPVAHGAGAQVNRRRESAAPQGRLRNIESINLNNLIQGGRAGGALRNNPIRQAIYIRGIGMGPEGNMNFFVPEDARIEDIIGRINNATPGTPQARRTPALETIPFADLEPMTLAPEQLDYLEANSRGFLISEAEGYPLSELLQMGDVEDHLVYTDGYVFDFRELVDYAQQRPQTYTPPPGVISHPMTNTPIDLRAPVMNQQGMPGARDNRPQRLERATLERLLQRHEQQQAAASMTPNDSVQAIDPPAGVNVNAAVNQGGGLSRSTSTSSIATVDEMQDEFQVGSYIKRYNANSGSIQRGLERHLHRTFEQEQSGVPTILTQGVSTRDGGRASALDVAAHYGRVEVAEQILEMGDHYNVRPRSARGQPEAAILAQAEENAGLYDGRGRRTLEMVD